MRLRTNISALRSQRYVKVQTNEVARSQRKLSSGERITRAGDDAAGLSLATKMRANIASEKQALRSVSDGVSILQVAEGSLSEISNMISRIRELAVQASTESIGQSERGLINLERDQLLKEIDRFAESTELNGRKLLQGQNEKLDIIVGPGSESEDKIQIDLKELSQDTRSLGISEIDFRNVRQSQFSLVKLDYALNSVNKSRADLGAIQSRFESSIENLNVSSQNAKSAKGQIKDADYALETAHHASSQIKQQMAINTLKISSDNRESILKLI